MSHDQPAIREPRSGIPPWLTVAIAGAAFAAVTIAELRRPLRKPREPKARRVARNLAAGAASAAVSQVAQSVILAPVLRRTARKRAGLLNRIALPGPVRTIAAILLLDYTLWWWHWLNHKVPFLWRFHLVHHVDRDLDASTAFRFHFGEMALSAGYRAAQFRLLGIDSASAALWQTAMFVSTLFHHSNLRLPEPVEGRLVRWVVTPRMHGIHHSDALDETDSNWSSLLSCWDVAHGTFRFDVPQEAITIGVPAWQRATDVTLGRILLMPFEPQRADWEGPGEISGPPSPALRAGD